MRLSNLVISLSISANTVYTVAPITPGANAAYDYVVIGGGTAGITIAARLSEDPNISVAIIEAGGSYETDNGNLSTIPGLSLSSPFLSTAVPYQPNNLVDWNLVSVPQSGAAGRQIHYAQGKTLAGSSALNSLAYHRATNGTYQRWADLVGDQSYTFANLLPYFKKSCHFTPPDLAERATPNSTVDYDPTAFSPSGGPLQVSWPKWVDTPLTWFQKAFSAIGLPISNENFNSGDIIGNAAWVASTVDPTDAVRSSSQSSFLVQAMNRTNLAVYSHTQAQKILFNTKGSEPVAVGVTVGTNSSNFTISARKEVIISAGVFHSPQLLMVSGIGPKATLSQHNITPISHLEGVGQNLWDQILFPVVHAMNLPTATQLITLPPYAPITTAEYLENASGPLSSMNGFIAFEKIPAPLRTNFTKPALDALATFPPDWPEVEYVSSSSAAPTGAGLGIILAALDASFSRGNITLASASITDAPIINLNWLTDPQGIDAQVAIAALKRIRQAWSSIPQITLGPEAAPGPNVTSDADILEYIQGAATTIYHAAGTCAMGKKGEKGAVVDSNARVFGVKGLRVVDNSASPFAVPGHPQSTVYMLAEKIADVIRKGK